MSQMLASLGDNQMFGAGFGLISIGLAATVARKGMQVNDCKLSCFLSPETCDITNVC